MPAKPKSRTKKPVNGHEGPPREKVDRAETDAAVTIARAWLAKAGFHEDPTGDDSTRVEMQGPGWDGRSLEHYVDVRVYIPALDIDRVVDGTHPDGISVDGEEA